MSRKLIYYGDPVLRRKTPPLEGLPDFLPELTEDMLRIMREHRGWGLAAPQVGLSLRLFVTDTPIFKPDGTEEPGKPLVYINPRLVELSGEKIVAEEGCLSVPGIRLPVERPARVVVEASNLEGERFTREVFGFEARCVVHENDHLNGVLYFDRVKGRPRRAIDPYLKEIKRKFG